MEHGHGTGCSCHGHVGHHENLHSAGSCCHMSVHGRHFLTKEERVKHLENYLENLKAESAGVEEEISRLKS